MFRILPEETQHMNVVWKYVKCIEVTVIFLISFIFTCIVHCGSNVMPNKGDAIQQFIVSSSLYLLSLIYVQSQVLSNKSESTLPSDNPVLYFTRSWESKMFSIICTCKLLLILTLSYAQSMTYSIMACNYWNDLSLWAHIRLELMVIIVK